MTSLLTFKLEKLKIHVYTNSTRSEPAISSIEAMFNPESYSLRYQNVYARKQGINTSGRKATFAFSKPQELRLTFILDDSITSITGLIFRKSVKQRVKDFLEHTCYMDGQIHEPRYLKIEWGDLIFDCRLNDVEIKYTLFARNGDPLRAELQSTFVADIDDDKRTRKEGKKSPDLTHVRLIKENENLPLWAHRIYKDPRFYIHLARVNRMDNFRNLKVGETIKFPPIKSK